MGFLKKSSANLKSSLKGLKGSIFAKSNNTIIHNRIVLYFIFLISLGNLFYLTVERDFKSIVVFIIVAFLTAFFSKNMVIILVVALAITNIVKFGSRITREGLDGEEEDEDEEDKKEGLEGNEEEEEEKKEGLEGKEKAKKEDSKKESKTTTTSKDDDAAALNEIKETIQGMLKNQK